MIDITLNSKVSCSLWRSWISLFYIPSSIIRRGVSDQLLPRISNKHRIRWLHV